MILEKCGVCKVLVVRHEDQLPPLLHHDRPGLLVQVCVEGLVARLLTRIIHKNIGHFI